MHSKFIGGATKRTLQSFLSPSPPSPSLSANRPSAIASSLFPSLSPPPLYLSLSLSLLFVPRLSTIAPVSLSVAVPLAVRSLSSVPFPIGQRSKGIQSRRSGNGWVKKKKKQVDRVRHLFVQRIYPGVVIPSKIQILYICSFLPLSSVYRSLVYRSMYRYMNFVENLYELITFRRILESEFNL